MAETESAEDHEEMVGSIICLLERYYVEIIYDVLKTF